MDLNLTISNTMPQITEYNIKDLCPDIYSIYIQWYTAFVILFALFIFGMLFLYIYMDIRITKERKKYNDMLKGICPNSEKCEYRED